MSAPLEPDLQVVSDVLAQDKDARLTQWALFLCCHTRLNRARMRLDDACFRELLDGYGAFDAAALRKERLKKGAPLVALWVIFLRYFERHLGDTCSFKYVTEEGLPCEEAFAREYGDAFQAEDAAERTRLLRFANWMGAMRVPYRGSKGFYLLVLPKFLEGFDARYTLGTGQSRGASNRCRVFHHESQTPLFKRRHTPYVRPQLLAEEQRVVTILFSDVPLVREGDDKEEGGVKEEGRATKRARTEAWGEGGEKERGDDLSEEQAGQPALSQTLEDAVTWLRHSSTCSFLYEWASCLMSVSVDASHRERSLLETLSGDDRDRARIMPTPDGQQQDTINQRSGDDLQVFSV